MQVLRSYSLPKYEGFSNGSETNANGKLSKKMALISLGVNLLVSVLGFILLLATFFTLYDIVSRTGVIISSLVIGAGIVGISEAILFRSVQIKTVYMVALILLITMLFSFTNQVNFVVSDDCAKAELYLRVHGIQETVKQMKTDEMMLTVLSRMKDMEDMMDILSNDDVNQENLNSLGLNNRELKHLDDATRVIRVKIAHLQKHAEQILNANDNALQGVRQQTQELEEKRVKGEKVQGKYITQEQLEDVRQFEKDLKGRVDRTKLALDYLTSQHVNEDKLTMDDYSKILDILNEGAFGGHEGVSKMKQEKEDIAAYFEKRDVLQKKRDGAYPAAGPDFTSWKMNVAERNKKLDHFWQLFQENRNAKQFHERAIEHLPDHCLTEYTSVPYITMLCWGIIICLSIGMYTMFTSAFIQVSSKKQY